MPLLVEDLDDLVLEFLFCFYDPRKALTRWLWFSPFFDRKLLQQIRPQCALQAEDRRRRPRWFSPLIYERSGRQKPARGCARGRPGRWTRAGSFQHGSFLIKETAQQPQTHSSRKQLHKSVRTTRIDGLGEGKTCFDAALGSRPGACYALPDQA